MTIKQISAKLKKLDSGCFYNCVRLSNDDHFVFYKWHDDKYHICDVEYKRQMLASAINPVKITKIEKPL